MQIIKDFRPSISANDSFSLPAGCSNPLAESQPLQYVAFLYPGKIASLDISVMSLREASEQHREIINRKNSGS